MDRLLAIKSVNDILPEYRDTPIGKLLEYHNLNRKHDSFAKAQLVIGMCIDYRENLHIPDNFAFIIRTAGANLQNSEFNVSSAIAFGHLKYLAVIGHSECKMAQLSSHKSLFIEGLEERAGWDREKAEEHFKHFVPGFETGDETDFLLCEASRLRKKDPGIIVAPMLYDVNDHLLYLINEKLQP